MLRCDCIIVHSSVFTKCNVSQTTLCRRSGYGGLVAYAVYGRFACFRHFLAIIPRWTFLTLPIQRWVHLNMRAMISAKRTGQRFVAILHILFIIYNASVAPNELRYAPDMNWITICSSDIQHARLPSVSRQVLLRCALRTLKSREWIWVQRK